LSRFAGGYLKRVSGGVGVVAVIPLAAFAALSVMACGGGLSEDEVQVRVDAATGRDAAANCNPGARADTATHGDTRAERHSTATRHSPAHRHTATDSDPDSAGHTTADPDSPADVVAGRRVRAVE
jgi:hypothetical protein